MHEPIISRELFDEALKRLIVRKKTIKAKDEPALFAGLFYCEACGTSGAMPDCSARMPKKLHDSSWN